MNEWSNSEGPDALQLLSDVALESQDAFTEVLRMTSNSELEVNEGMELKQDAEDGSADEVQTEEVDEEGRADVVRSDLDVDPCTESAEPSSEVEAGQESEEPEKDVAVGSNGTDLSPVDNVTVQHSDCELETTTNSSLNNGDVVGKRSPPMSEVVLEKRKRSPRMVKSKRLGTPPSMWRHLRLQKGHHELLEVLIRAEFGSVDMSAMQRCITKYSGLGWTPTRPLPSSGNLYSFPLLHWAAVLGRFKAVKWLLDKGFSSLDQSEETGETALHAAALYLVDARRKVAPAKYIFERLVGLLRDSMIVQDNEMASPMHRAAEQLILGVHPDHYEHCLVVMLAQTVSAFGCASQVADLQNRDGDTVLHILCKYDSVTHPTIKAFLEAGADANMQNNQGLTAAEVAILHGAEKNAKLLQSIHPLSGSLRSAAILASALNTAQHGPALGSSTISEKGKTDASVAAGHKPAGGRKGRERKTTGKKRRVIDPGHVSRKPHGINEKADSGKKVSQSLCAPLYKKKVVRQQTTPKSIRPGRVPNSASPAVADMNDGDTCTRPATTSPPLKRRPKSSSASKAVPSRPSRQSGASSQPPVSTESVKRKPEPLSLASSKRPKLQQPARPKTPKLERAPKIVANRRKRTSSRKARPSEPVEDVASGDRQQEGEVGDNMIFPAYVFPSDQDGMMEVSYEPKQEEDANNLASGTEIYCDAISDGGQMYSLKALPTPLNSPYFLQARHNLDAILGRLKRKSEGSESGVGSPSAMQSLTPDSSLMESLMASGLMDQLPDLAKKAKAETEQSLCSIETDINDVDSELDEACKAVEKKCVEIGALTDQAEMLMRELDDLRHVEDGIREKKRKAEDRLEMAKARMAHCDRIAEEAPLLHEAAVSKLDSSSHGVSGESV